MWFEPLYTWPAPGSMAKPTEAPVHLVVHATDDKGTAHIQLDHPPVNALSAALFQELNQWVLWLGSDPQTKAVVISSAVPEIFCGGGEFTELLHRTPEQFQVFWHAMQEMWLILNTCPKPLVAAINGSSAGSGCALCLAADYRVMTRGRDEGKGKPYVIGLNETQLGVVAPPFAADSFAHVVGPRKAEYLLQLGAMPSAEEAMKIGLVDEVHDTDADCLAAALKQAAALSSTDPQARTLSRDIARRGYLQPFATKEGREADMMAMTELMLSDRVQGILEGYTAAIQNKSKKQ